jgi:hypothetical protein
MDPPVTIVLPFLRSLRTMKLCLTDIVQQVKELENGITVRDKKFDIEFYMGGD